MEDNIDRETQIMIKEMELRDLVPNNAKEALARLSDDPKDHARQRKKIQQQIEHYKTIINSLTVLIENDREEYGD